MAADVSACFMVESCFIAIAAERAAVRRAARRCGYPNHCFN
jgi:hypothetical protein